MMVKQGTDLGGFMKLLTWLVVFSFMFAQGAAYATLDGGGSIRVDMDQDRGTDNAGGRSSGPGVDDEWGDAGMTREFLKHASDKDLDEIWDDIFDEGMSLEDAIENLLMKMAAHMDEEIEKQAKKVDEVRDGGGPQTNREPNTDLETQKLKQLTERRGQLFETVRQTSENLGKSDEKTIQALGR